MSRTWLVRSVKGSCWISVIFSPGSDPRVGSRKRRAWRLTSNSILPMNLLRAVRGLPCTISGHVYLLGDNFPTSRETSQRYFRVCGLSESQRFALSESCSVFAGGRRFAPSEMGGFSALLALLLLLLADLRAPRRSNANAAPAMTKQNAPMAKVAISPISTPPAAATAGVHHKAK